MDTMVIIWLVLVVAFVVAELASVGLTSIWFAVGSLAALLVAMAKGNIAIQIIVFLIVSIGLLWATKPWAKKYINSRTTKTNVDSVIGQKAVITQRVSNLDQTGKTVLSGQEWTVRAEDDREIFEEGDLTEVVRVSGVKLIVKKIIKEETTCQE